MLAIGIRRRRDPLQGQRVMQTPAGISIRPGPIFVGDGLFNGMVAVFAHIGPGHESLGLAFPDEMVGDDRPAALRALRLVQVEQEGLEPTAVFGHGGQAGQSGLQFGQPEGPE